MTVSRRTLFGLFAGAAVAPMLPAAPAGMDVYLQPVTRVTIRNGTIRAVVELRKFHPRGVVAQPIPTLPAQTYRGP